MAFHEDRIEIAPSSVVSMISRNEMPSMPTTYPAPMEGIQLFGWPSTKRKPERSLTAQNQGTSGSETANPRKAKMFATQRIASLFSFGNSSRRIAPTSGVNKIIERMWLYIKSVLSFQPSANPVEPAFRPAFFDTDSGSAGL